MNANQKLPSDEDITRFFQYVSSLRVFKNRKVELYILCTKKAPYTKRDYIINDDCIYTMRVKSLKDFKAKEILKKVKKERRQQQREEERRKKEELRKEQEANLPKALKPKGIVIRDSPPPPARSQMRPSSSAASPGHPYQKPPLLVVSDNDAYRSFFTYVTWIS